MDRTTRLAVAAALTAAGLFPASASAQGVPDGVGVPVAQPGSAASPGDPPAAAPPFPGDIGGQYETRQGSYRPVVQQRFQPDGQSRVTPNVQQRFPTPDRKGDYKGEPPDQKPEQPVPAVPAAPPVTPPAPAPVVTAPPAAPAPQPEETPPPAPQVRGLRLPQTGGDPLTLVGLGAGLAGVGLVLRRRGARA